MIESSRRSRRSRPIARDRARVAFVNERMLLGFGVDLVIDRVASELAARGHDVTVYASVTDHLPGRPYTLDRVPTRASGLAPRYEGAAARWARYIDAHRHDVVFVESYPFFSLIPLLKTPAVAVDHGVSSTEGMSARQRAMFRYIQWVQQNRYFPKARAIVTVSDFVRHLLPRRLAERARVIYNGTDHYPKAAPGEREAARTRLGIGDDEVMMLYVGRLNPEGQPYKGTADLMRAASRWRDSAPHIRVVMAGKGSHEDAARIAEAGAIPLLDVPEEDMSALNSAADLYLTASRWEGFDMPLMEAAYQGVPSVALRVGAHPEVVKDGETGILCDDITGLLKAARRLADDPARRRAMGEAARAWAGQLTWARATDAYAEVVAEIREGAASAATPSRPPRHSPAPGSPAPSSRETSDITAIVLNYGATFDILQKCVGSLESQTYPVKTLLVDNGSPKNQDAVNQIKREFPDVELLVLDKNYGFAGGMNRGIKAAKTEFVLLMNNDAVLAPDATEQMRALIEGRPDVVGIAPKIMLEGAPGYIDAIGNVIDPQGQAFNVGIGQLDIGQYDRVEETFGACFAATLLRREAFHPGLVGPMDETYFMYYEDVDWCFRAGILGYKFLTCPSAVVQHAHSLSTRELNYGYKYRMIMRNFVRTLLKDFQGRRALRASAKRSLGLARNVLRGPHRKASFLALKDIGLSVGEYYLRKRPDVQGRRKVDDQALFNYSHGEQPFFDPTGYQPVRNLEALQAMYRRLYLISGDDRHRIIADTSAAVAGSRMRFNREFVLAKLRPLVADEPASVREFVEDLVV